MSSPLHLHVFVVPYKPIVGLIPPMSAGEATWPATSVSLITGERDAVLIDAALTPEDDPAAILGGTKTYIRDFERSLSESHSAQRLVDKMMALHGDLGNPYTLWTAAQGVFEQGQGASS